MHVLGRHRGPRILLRCYDWHRRQQSLGGHVGCGEIRHGHSNSCHGGDRTGNSNVSARSRSHVRAIRPAAGLSLAEKGLKTELELCGCHRSVPVMRISCISEADAPACARVDRALAADASAVDRMSLTATNGRRWSLGLAAVCTECKAPDRLESQVGCGQDTSWGITRNGHLLTWGIPRTRDSFCRRQFCPSTTQPVQEITVVLSWAWGLRILPAKLCNNRAWCPLPQMTQ